MKISISGASHSILSPNDYSRLYRRVQRRVKAGISLEDALKDTKNRAGHNQNNKTTPTDVLNIYSALFHKEKSQTALSREYGIAQSTISDIWRHKRWNWLTAPLRYELEQQVSKSHDSNRKRICK